MSLSLENVREQLLRAGIAPGQVKRYVGELHEHLADLVARERAAGVDAQQARARATALLGTEAQLVQAMLNSGVPRSLAARAPWSVFTVIPLVLLVAVTAATGVAMFRLLWPIRDLTPAELSSGYASLIAITSFVTNYLVGPLLAAGCIVMALRQRMASAWVWVGLALIALISGLSGFHMHAVPAADGARGGMLFSSIGIVYRDGHPDLVATLGVAGLRAAVLFIAAAAVYRVLQLRLMSTGVQAPH
jgi:hypothetical protein